MAKHLKVGDKYSIVEDGKRLTGKIIQKDANGKFVVVWSDGEETREDDPSPMDYVRS